MYNSVRIALTVLLGIGAAKSASIIDINRNPLGPPTVEEHPIIDADFASNSLKEHLASIVDLNAPIDNPPPSILNPDAPMTLPDPSIPLPDAAMPLPDIAAIKEPSENDDLKTDSTLWGYGGYRSPYTSYYRPSYSFSNYWQYGNRYNRPFYNNYYNPFGYYYDRPSSYYPGNYIFSPYRRQYSSYY